MPCATIRIMKTRELCARLRLAGGDGARLKQLFDECLKAVKRAEAKAERQDNGVREELGLVVTDKMREDSLRRRGRARKP